jgi:uncharacterized repeat protein (TIGR04138 family)
MANRYMRHPEIQDIVRRDGRYAYEAYEFMFEALSHTQEMAGKVPIGGESPGEEHHVSGPEILMGAADLAREEFGFLARTVFHQWGVRRSDDLGEIVFNLIEAGLLSKTDTDSRADFHDVLDLDRALSEGYTIRLGEEAAARRGPR